jgi:hypothetical protein
MRRNPPSDGARSIPSSTTERPQPMRIRTLALVMFTAFFSFASQKATKSISEELSGAARSAFDQGKTLFEHGDYVTAHAKFKAAYEQSKNPRLFWNLAACSAKEKRYARAIDEAERQLAEGRGKLTPEVQQRTLDFLAEMRGYVAEAVFTLNPSGAELSVDGESRGTQGAVATVTLELGRHELGVTKSGFEPVTQLLQVRDTAKIVVLIVLKELASSARLVVQTDLDAMIDLDGRALGKGLFDGTVAAGSHTLRIRAQGKQAYENLVEMNAGVTKQLTVNLLPERDALSLALAPASSRGAASESSGATWWPWALGGTALAAGLGVGAYFLFKPSNIQDPYTPGTAGTIEVR